MMLQLAFILLCVAQIVHFSGHLFALGMGLRDEQQTTKIRNAVDWNQTTRRRKPPKTGLLEKLKKM